MTNAECIYFFGNWRCYVYMLGKFNYIKQSKMLIVVLSTTVNELEI